MTDLLRRALEAIRDDTTRVTTADGAYDQHVYDFRARALAAEALRATDELGAVEVTDAMIERAAYVLNDYPPEADTATVARAVLEAALEASENPPPVLPADHPVTLAKRLYLALDTEEVGEARCLLAKLTQSIGRCDG